jgi:hypothetical protein
VGGTWAAPRRATPPQRRGPATAPRPAPSEARRPRVASASRRRGRCWDRRGDCSLAAASSPPRRARPRPAVPSRPVGPGRAGRGDRLSRPPPRPSRSGPSPSPDCRDRLRPRPSAGRPSRGPETASRRGRADRPGCPDRRGPRPESDCAPPDRPGPLRPLPRPPRVGGGPAPGRPRLRSPGSEAPPRGLVGAMANQRTCDRVGPTVSQYAKRAAPQGGPLQGEIRRRPTLPGSLLPSTIGAGGLNFRVRYGNGCDPSAMATENLLSNSGPRYLAPAP